MRFTLFWNITQRIVTITDVSGQTIGLIFKGQEIQDPWILGFLDR